MQALFRTFLPRIHVSYFHYSKKTERINLFISCYNQVYPKSNRFTTNHIKKFLGYMPLCEIRTMHIQQMHNSLDLSSKYQHCIHAILSNMFEIAVQNDLIVKNPCCHTYFLPFCMTAMQFIEFRSAYFNFVSEWYHIEF